jgi:predicted amidohydrolase
MRLCLAQVDCRLGDLEANAHQARATIGAARRLGAELVVFPELSLTGYALGTVEHDTATTAAELPPIAGDTSVLLGFREREGVQTYNSAAFLQGGSIVHVHRKLYLVDYPPFDEASLFAPGDAMRAFDTRLGRFATLICNDAWQPFLPVIAVQDGACLLLVPSNSSTAVAEAETYWRELTRFYARILQCYVVFVNRVGSEAGLTFWGGSHVVDPFGEVVAEAPRLEKSLLIADLDLEAVQRRRRQLPLVGKFRPELLRAELARLAGDA